MPSVNASRKGQEKPREIVDAAEVGSLLPRVGARAEGGSGAVGALAALGAPTALYQQAAAWSGAPHAWARGPSSLGLVFLENRGLGEVCSWGGGGGGGRVNMWRPVNRK